jgi:hypothetical protein
MAIVELLKTYGLNRDLIESDRWMSERLAQAHENTSRELLKDADDQRFVHLMASATEYRRAGAHSLLLSDRKSANKMFQAAANSYIRLNNPYALMMLSCADANPDSVRAFVHDLRPGEHFETTQLPYLFVTTSLGGESQERVIFDRVRDLITAARNTPIGVLGIQVGAYLDLADVLANEDATKDRLMEALLPFLVPYSIALRRCMEDAYHWERLAFPFHPAEPDVLGTVFCVEETLRRRQKGSLLSSIREAFLGETSSRFLSEALLDRFEGGHKERSRS